jgi:hypothetical protein
MPSPTNDKLLEEKRQHYSSLLEENDETLFGHGACHIFALELNRRYGYPLRICQRDNGRVPHAFCLRHGKPFDVRAGKKPRYFFEDYGGTPRDTTAVELEAMFSGENWNGLKFGLGGEESFLKEAMRRARNLARRRQYTPGTSPNQ